MPTDDDVPGLLIESFDPHRHERTAFFSGVERIDNFLKRTARKQQDGDFTRIWVAVEPGNPAILGYYAMNAHALEQGEMPPEMARDAPRHGSIPAAYLSIIGVTATRQGSGLGRVLLADALVRAARAADHIGLKAVILDVIADGGEADTNRHQSFYRRMGFTPLPTQGLRMFITIKDVKKAMDV